jgi:hypothetical protein
VIDLNNYFDLRTSQNASYSNSINIPILVANAPQLIGRIGLSTVGAGANIRVLLQGLISLQLPLLPVITTVTLRIVRGNTPDSPLVFSSSQNMNLNITGPQTFTINALDFNPPNPGIQLTYSMYAEVSLIGVVRVGPENFSGFSVSD